MPIGETSPFRSKPLNEQLTPWLRQQSGKLQHHESTTDSKAVTTAMNILQLLKDRGCGFLKIAFSSARGDSLEAVISRMGFDVSTTDLRAIDAIQAEAALSNLFSRDLAYGGKVMDADVARRYASDLVTEYAGTAAKIFTNAHWENGRLAGLNPVTKATFNVLILIIRTDFAVSVLVEDED